MTRRATRLLSGLSLAIGVFALAAGGTSAAGDREVVVLPTTGIVDQGMAHYLADGIARAERDGAAAVVIKLNTPGGILDATNDIVGTLLESKVPIIVWVAPAGGFAASAGTFITLAANVAVMAPGHEHRRRVAGRRPGRGHPRHARREGQERRDRQDHRRSPRRVTGNVDWAVSTVEDAKSSPVERGGRASVRSTAWPRRSTRSSPSPTAGRSRSRGADVDARPRRRHDRPRCR